MSWMGNNICDGCNVRHPHEHRCHGEGCECRGMTCLMQQGRNIDLAAAHESFASSPGDGRKWKDGSACFSLAEHRRYELTRSWTTDDQERYRTILFIMLNPSKAGAKDDDPTIRRIIGFAKSFGANRVIACNLFSKIATKPIDLYKFGAIESVYSESENRNIIAKNMNRAHIYIYAWGAHGNIGSAGLKFKAEYPNGYHIGELTKRFMPRHPLMLKGTLPLIDNDRNVFFDMRAITNKK